MARGRRKKAETEEPLVTVDDANVNLENSSTAESLIEASQNTDESLQIPGSIKALASDVDSPEVKAAVTEMDTENEASQPEVKERKKPGPKPGSKRKPKVLETKLYTKPEPLYLTPNASQPKVWVRGTVTILNEENGWYKVIATVGGTGKVNGYIKKH